MVKLFIKENKTNNQRMTVRDDRGQILYLIEGRWGRKGDIVTLQALSTENHLTAKQNKLSPLPTFDLSNQDEKLGYIRKYPGLFGIRDSYFTVQPNQWVITGDFEELYFTAHYKNELVMECEKIQKNSCGHFELIVTKEEDVPLCALITVLLDHYVRRRIDDELTDTVEDEEYNLGFLNNYTHSITFKSEQIKTR